VQRKTKALLIAAVALGALVLAGFVGVSVQDDEFVPYRPNDRANHHPVHPANGMANHHPVNPTN
jgi:hypothetical protein